MAVAFSGCAKDGELILNDIPNTCGGTGHTLTWIKYGDSHLGALALSKIGRKSEWWFKLQPDNPGGGAYADKVVTITAKPNPTPPPDNEYPWLSVSGRHSDDPVLVVCVPESLELNERFDYMIEVEDVGVLDPRAEVVN